MRATALQRDERDRGVGSIGTSAGVQAAMLRDAEEEIELLMTPLGAGWVMGTVSKLSGIECFTADYATMLTYAQNATTSMSTGQSWKIAKATAEGMDDTAQAASAFTGPAILEVKRISGLTWDELARIFGRDRRSLHFWASGRAMGQKKEEQLSRLLATVRRIDRGFASENRALLLTPTAEGVIPFDLLCAGDWDRAVEIVGAGSGERRSVPPPLSAKARGALRLRPRSPAERLETLPDSVHKDEGVVLSITPIRTRHE